MDKKIFWLLFTVLGAVMGFLLPLWWNLALTLPLLVLVLIKIAGDRHHRASSP